MEAYKFKTKVSENGTIIVPDVFNFKNKEVEVTIIGETAQNEPKRSMKDFLDKFSGVLKGVDPDKAKYDYLMDKHK